MSRRRLDIPKGWVIVLIVLPEFRSRLQKAYLHNTIWPARWFR